MNTMFLDSNVAHADHDDDNRPTAVLGHYAPSSPVVPPVHMSQLPMKYAPAPAAYAPASAASAPQPYLPSAPVSPQAAVAVAPKAAVKVRVPLSLMGMLLVPAAMLVVSGGMAVQSLLELI